MYDPATQTDLLFGGYGNDTTYDDTWTWNGTNWTQLSPANSPAARGGADMAYDAALGQMILYGGYSSTGAILSDTWEWTGTNWSQLSPATNPGPLALSGVTYDPSLSSVVLG